MMGKSPPVWKAALALLSVRLVVAQLGLAVGVFLLSLVWLRLPDASVLEVLASGLLALFIVVAAGMGESRLILGLAGRAATLRRTLRGMLPLFLGIVLCFAWSAWLAHLGAKDSLHAGYLNSRAPQHLRHLLSFEHIQLWLGWMWSILRWMGAGFVAAFVFPWVAGERRLRAAGVTLRTASFWIVLLFAAVAATLFTCALMGWLPLHGLWPEMFSLGVRLAIAAVVDAAFACWFLATLAVCLHQVELGYAAPAGSPEDSQLRTTGMP